MRKRHVPALLVCATLVFGVGGAGAQTVIGDLNNFDTLNDTGQVCYGFEIEIEGVHSTDITYTYDWNHYGAPKIREDNSGLLPRVFVRYESTKDSNGRWGANNSFTNMATPTITPPQGHSCTDPSVNEGCEHFGVGYYGTPAKVTYRWLIDDNAGGLTYVGTPVGVATPKWVYTPAADGNPAQVVAAIPAPVVPVAGKDFGEPSWVRVIKTVSHNARPVALADLISEDSDGDGLAEWQNFEPDEIETEWKLLQASAGGAGPNEDLEGAPDDMGMDGAETVTRRYEFYKYAGDFDTLDGETGEAMCSDVDSTTNPEDPQYLHGIGIVVVTDSFGGSYEVDCSAQVVVGNYIGAQMAGFDAAAPLGLIDHLQAGESFVVYPPRTVVVGGTRPYNAPIFTSGSLPPGLSIGDYTDPDSGAMAYGVLFGTPTAGGDFPFTVHVTDASGITVSKTYSLHIVGPPVEQVRLTVDRIGTGAGTVAGNGIDCGATCAALFDSGTSISLSATAAAGSRFASWTGACTGTADCAVTLSASSIVTAEFTKQWLLSAATAGGGAGTVSGNGIDCGSTCNVVLDEGTLVSLTATPSGSNVFTGWSGDCSGAGACSPAMTADRSVTATFVPPTQQYALTVDVTGSGTVSSSPKGINCGRQCSKSFTVGTSVTLTAKPAKKHLFLGWTGACAASGTSLTCTIPLRKAETAGALFN